MAGKRGVSKASFARAHGISRQAVGQAVAEGRLTTAPDGSVDPVAAGAELAGSTLPRSGGPSPQGEPESLVEARKQLMAAKAQRERLKLEAERGLWVRTAEVENEMYVVAKVTKDRLQSVPNRVIPRVAQWLAPGVDSRVVLQVIAEEVGAVLDA